MNHFLLNLIFSSFSQQWFGEGEKYVKAVFSLASKIAPSVVFVDEVSSETTFSMTSKIWVISFYLILFQLVLVQG